MITFFARFVPEWVAKLIVYVGLPLLAALLIWLWIDGMVDRAYDKGVKETDAAWVEAGQRLRDRAVVAAGEADAPAAKRAEAFAAAQAEEKERIDEAIAVGASPFDVMFGGDGVSGNAADVRSD